MTWLMALPGLCKSFRRDQSWRTTDAKRSSPAARNIQTSYDRGSEYADEIYDELKGKPFDRALLDGFAERLSGQAGCAMRAVVRHKSHAIFAIAGRRLWPGFLPGCWRRRARLNPDLQFVQCSMLALDWFRALGGICRVLFHHSHTRKLVVAALSEMRRVLQRAASF